MTARVKTKASTIVPVAAFSFGGVGTGLSRKGRHGYYRLYSGHRRDTEAIGCEHVLTK